MKHIALIKWLLPLIIFLFALTSRLYQLPQVFLFGADEEYQATYARTIAEDFHVVWIGVSAGNTGFYLGPGWTYLTALLLKLSSGDPLITGYFAAILGALTASLIYLLGKEMVGKTSALIASILYSVSPLVIYFDQKYWNPSALPLLSLLLIYSAYKNIPFLFALTSGLVLHTHLSLIPLILLLAAIYFRQFIAHGSKRVTISIIIFLVTVSPLIAFDYFHKGSNISTPLRMREIKSGLTGGGIFQNGNRWLNMLGRSWYLKPGLSNANEARPLCAKGTTTVSSYLLILLSTIPIIFAGLNLLTLSYFSIVIPFLLYPGVGFEYYLLGVVPLYFLMVGRMFARLPRVITFLIISIFIVASIYTLIHNTSPYGLSAKKLLISETMKHVGNEPFMLIESGICHRYEGWRYLYTVYGRYPVASSIDGTYGWLYPKEISTVAPTIQLEIYGTGPIPTSAGQLIQVGGFTAIISKL